MSPGTPDARAAQIAEALIGVALRTEVGQAYWNGFLIGGGHAKGRGRLEVLHAAYRGGAPTTPANDAGPPENGRGDAVGDG